MAEIVRFRLVCVTTIGVCVFRCAASVAHFLFFGGVMRRVDKLGRIVIEDNILAAKGEC